MNTEGVFPSRIYSYKSRDITDSDVTRQSIFDIRDRSMSHEDVFPSWDDHDVTSNDVVRRNVLDPFRVTRIQSMVAGNVSNKATHASSFPTKDGSFRHPGIGNIRNPEGPVILEEYCKSRLIVRGSPLGYFQSNAESNP